MQQYTVIGEWPIIVIIITIDEYTPRQCCSANFILLLLRLQVLLEGMGNILLLHPPSVTPALT